MFDLNQTFHSLLIALQYRLKRAVCVLKCLYVPYSGKLSREKTFANFADLGPSVKVFSLESLLLYGILCMFLYLLVLTWCEGHQSTTMYNILTISCKSGMQAYCAGTYTCFDMHHHTITARMYKRTSHISKIVALSWQLKQSGLLQEPHR